MVYMKYGPIMNGSVRARGDAAAPFVIGPYCVYILSHLINSSCLSCYFCWSNNFWDGKQHLFRLASLAKQSNVVFVRRNSNNIKELVVERFLKKAIIAKPLI